MKHGRLETKEWVVIIIFSFIGCMLCKYFYDMQMYSALNPPKEENKEIVIYFKEID
jgi:hypothetical protein